MGTGIITVLSCNQTELKLSLSLQGKRANREAMRGASHRYKPEAHYMRGPGPRWFAKHVQHSTRHFEQF
jgi:hypothetical protein